MTCPTKYLVLVVSSLSLVACGGGGGSAGEPAATINTDALPEVTTPIDSVASAVLIKYEGEWQQACVDHIHRTTTFKAISANIFTVTPEETHYAIKDCTGAVVATGRYGVPSETVTYVETPLNATMTLTDGSTIQADVNTANSSIATATFTLTGSGVQPSYNFGGTIMTPVQYADEILPRLYPARALTGGTTQGALLLRYENLPNEELLTLVAVPDSPTSFAVKFRFFR